MVDVTFAHNGPHRYIDTAAASDVSAWLVQANVPAASQLIASRPRRRRAPRLDESIVQGVPGRNLQCTVALLGLGFTVIRLLFRVAVGVIGLG